MISMSSLEDILLRLEAISLLRRLKRNFKYRELSGYLGLDIPLLSKYVNGKLLPGKLRAWKIIQKILEITNIEDEIKNALNQGIYSYPELMNLSASSPDLLFYIAIQAYKLYKNFNITKVLSIEGSGLIIASLIATLLNKGLVYALRDHYIKDAVIELYSTNINFVQAKYMKFIALPRKSLQSNDKVLIVDDIIWSGATIKALLNIARKLNSEVIGVFCVGVFSKKIVEEIKENYGVKISYLIQMPTMLR